MRPRVAPLPVPANVKFSRRLLLHFSFARTNAPSHARAFAKIYITATYNCPAAAARLSTEIFERRDKGEEIQLHKRNAATSFLTTADLSHNTRQHFTQHNQHFPESNLTVTNRKQRTPNWTFIET
jgi:hypothetical protein